MEGDSELADLYRDVLIDYFRDDTYKGEIAGADISAHGVNPTCGDEIKVSISMEGDNLHEIRFNGHGCVISQASSGMMCEALEGVRKFPIRIKCALLAWITCLQGLDGALKGEKKSQYTEVS